MSSLSHLKVLDLTNHLSGPYCAMILADHGADVVKVENPASGDSLRMTPPFQEGESAPFMLWNRNKRSIALNFKDPGDLRHLKEMIKVADVLIENFKPGVAERLGFGYAAASEINPRLIYCSISGFGQTGPYAPRGGFDLIACGMSGLMAVNGPPDGPPYRIPVPVTDVCGGMNGAIGVLTALAAREQTGKGQHVDTSLFESGIALGVYEAANVFANGEVPERLGQAHRGSAPYQLFPTADGYMTIGGAQDNFWRGTCKILGCEHLIDDPRFKSKADRVANNKALVPELEVYFKKQTTADLCAACDAAGIPAGPVMDHVEVYNDPQTIAREMAVDVDHPKVGPMKTIGIPVKLSETPGSIRRPAPLLGEHTGEVIAEWTGLAVEAADD
jgi:crotonobetainyl-CoA:carnitine CoA-transferase CaiB-like acyl-CoA transferase